MARLRPAFPGIVALCLPCGLSCGDRTDPRPQPGAAADAPTELAEQAPEPVKQATALPAERPTPFEAEYRVRPEPGGAPVMIKLTLDGIRYSTGDEEHRVTLTYAAEPAAIDRVYAAMRGAAFDRIETKPVRESNDAGTSIRLVAGTIRHSVSDMGRVYPKVEWAKEYEAAARAMESLLPTAAARPSSATIEVRWDASMKGHRASIDLPLGDDFAGIERVGPTHADVRVHASNATARELTLRHGPPAAQSKLTLDPAKHAGAVVAFDEETGAPVVRLSTAAELAARTSAADTARSPPARTPGPG